MKMKLLECKNCKSKNINEWYFDNEFHKCRNCGNYFKGAKV